MWITTYLKPLQTDCYSEEDADSKAQMAKAFSNWKNDGEDLVVSTEGNRNNKDVTEQKDEVCNTESSEKVVEDIVHRPR